MAGAFKYLGQPVTESSVRVCYMLYPVSPVSVGCTPIKDILETAHDTKLAETREPSLTVVTLLDSVRLRLHGRTRHHLEPG